LDAFSAVFGAGVVAARHHQRAVGLSHIHCRRNVQLPGGLLEYREQHAAKGFGGVGMPGRGGKNDGAVGQLAIGPTAGPAIERLDQMMAPIYRRTFSLPTVTAYTVLDDSI
jgi:hypothetical protein